MAIRRTINERHEWLTPAEVAELYRVDSKTVARWAQAGTIPEEDILWTLGQKSKGHRRYRRAFFEQQMNGGKP